VKVIVMRADCFIEQKFEAIRELIESAPSSACSAVAAVRI
jgi:hypothetical protein